MTTKPKIDDAPGLIWRASKSGWTATWQCRTDLARRGYPTKSQRILECGNVPTDAERLLIAARCTALQAEMLAWGRGGAPTLPGGNTFDGTLESLIRCYQTDPTSGFAKMRFMPRQNTIYRHNLIIKDHGKFLIADIRLRTVTLWRQAWIDRAQARRPGVPNAGVTMANALVDVVRVLLGYGDDVLEDKDCGAARMRLHGSKFEKAPSGEVYLLPEHAIAIRRMAHTMGRPSVALAQAIQFECGFRQKDVIGEWLPLDEKKAPPSDVIHNSQKWVWGVRWNEISEDGNKLNLAHLTSKRNKWWRGNIAPAQMIMEEFAALGCPLPKSGPVIIDESTGQPYRSSQFRKLWRKIATAAGVPAAVKNMHNRAGALTEAFDADIAPDKVRKFGVHSDLRTTNGYNRSTDGAVDEVIMRRNKTRTA